MSDTFNGFPRDAFDQQTMVHGETLPRKGRSPMTRHSLQGMPPPLKRAKCHPCARNTVLPSAQEGQTAYRHMKAASNVVCRCSAI
jgi:hypothetical protein